MSMRLNDISNMIGLIDDEILRQSDFKISAPRFKYKRYIVLATSLCLFVGISIVLFSIIKNQQHISNQNALSQNTSNQKNAGLLSWNTNIYPSVMFNGCIYEWETISGGASYVPEGILPEGYKSAGEIHHIQGDKLNDNYQFISGFDASGELYINASDPKHVCIRITTPWLNKSYVIFSIKE